MGFVRRHDGHAPPALGTTYTCGTVPVDIVRSVGTLGSPATFRLAHTGADYLVPCDRSRNGAVFDGVLVNGGPVGLPLMFVRANLRLQLATIPTAFKLAHAVYDLTSSADFFAIPYGSSLYYGQEAMIAPGTPGAFRTDSDTPGVVRRWAVSCPDILTANGSALHNVTAEYFNAALPSPDLYCVN